MRIGVYLDNLSYDLLRQLSERFGVDADDVIRLGIDVLYDILVSGAEGVNCLAKALREDRDYALHNVIVTGVEFYGEYIKRIFRELGLSEDTTIIECLVENGRFSALTLETSSEDVNCSEVYVFNHERPVTIQLCYYLDKENGRDWIRKLEEKKSDIMNELYERLELEGIDIAVEDMEDYYSVYVVMSTEDLIDVREIDKYIIKQLGPIPKEE